MNYQFTLPDFPDSTFEMQTSMWTGRSKLFQDGILVSRANESGRPFLITAASGDTVKAYPKPRYMDVVPVLEIDGIQYDVVEKLTWFQYVICCVPLLLIFFGGALGGGLGAVASSINLQIIRTGGSATGNYLKVLGITLAAFAFYFLVAYIIWGV